MNAADTIQMSDPEKDEYQNIKPALYPTPVKHRCSFDPLLFTESAATKFYAAASYVDMWPSRAVSPSPHLEHLRTLHRALTVIRVRVLE